MSESAGREVVAVGEAAVGPAASVSDDVVVSASRRQILDRGFPAFRPGDPMVQVTFGGRHPTSGEHTGPVPGFNRPTLRAGGPPASSAIE